VDLSAKYANAMIAAFAAEPLILHVVQTVKATAASTHNPRRSTRR